MLEFAEYDSSTYTLLAFCILACFLSYAFRLFIHVYTFKKQEQVPKKLVNFSLVFVFLGYMGWGVWCFADPVKLGLTRIYALSIGIPLTVLGFGLFFYSDIVKMGVKERDKLVTKGLYAKIRHPMYMGIVLFHIGFPIATNGFTALLSTIVWAGFIVVWKYYEEKNLELKFGEEYTEYKKKTWF